MIAFDFEYYKPDTLEEAISSYDRLSKDGKEPIYYGGGTEFISMARMNNIYAGAVIDIKAIPQCKVFEIRGDELIIGSALSLSEIAANNIFPLLSLTIERIADHTIQDKITLGGNLAGTIIYKEALLPLLVSNSQVLLAGKDGIRRLPIDQVFNRGLHLNKGDLIVQVIVKKEFLQLPYIHVKRTKNERIDYPLISMAALDHQGKINFALSGLCQYPFRSYDMEDILGRSDISFDEKISQIISKVPGPILDDIGGSSDFRIFMLEKILKEALIKLKEDL